MFNFHVVSVLLNRAKFTKSFRRIILLALTTLFYLFTCQKRGQYTFSLSKAILHLNETLFQFCTDGHLSPQTLELYSFVTVETSKGNYMISPGAVISCIFLFSLSSLAQLNCQNVHSTSDPAVFLSSQTTRILNLKTPQKNKQTRIELSEPSRKAFLETAYENNWVRADEQSKLLSDKLIFYATANQGKKSVSEFLPKTLGLKAILQSKGLLDKNKQIRTTEEQLRKVLLKEFPKGFIVKPATGFSSDGKGPNFYFSEELFIKDLLKPDTHLYKAKDFSTPFFAEVLNTYASGEALVLQAKAIPVTSAPKNNQNEVEFRVHIYERSVVRGASSGRWLQPINSRTLEIIESKVEQFLKSLPESMVTGSAWGMDVIFDGANIQIIDVNTNRGGKIQWSGYLPSPYVLQAYAKHFQNIGFAKWQGQAAEEILAGRGNIAQWIRKLPEEVEAHYKNLNMPIPLTIAQALQRNKNEE